MDKIEKRKRFIINIAFTALVLGLIFLFFKYAIKWVMPFVIGFIVSLMFRPIIKLTDKVLKIKNRVLTFFIVIIGYLLFGLILWRLGVALFEAVKAFSLNLPNIYMNEISPFFDDVTQGFINFSKRVSPETVEQMKSIIDNLTKNVQSTMLSFSGDVLSSLASLSKKLPFWLISFIFTILASIFISMDYEHVIEFMRRQLPDDKRNMLADIRSYLGKTLIGYSKAYLILVFLTFIEVSVGLLILRVGNPFGIAAIIAITDILPVLGTGTILIPWAILSVFVQDYYLAIGLFVLYLVVTGVRQFIEPKIVGSQLGLPPVVAIICIYLGYIWFGVFGIFLFPITANIILSLQKAGKIHLWVNKDE